jgi:hypothetical protein
MAQTLQKPIREAISTVWAPYSGTDPESAGVALRIAPNDGGCSVGATLDFPAAGYAPALAAGGPTVTRGPDGQIAAEFRATARYTTARLSMRPRPCKGAFPKVVVENKL